MIDPTIYPKPESALSGYGDLRLPKLPIPTDLVTAKLEACAIPYEPKSLAWLPGFIGNAPVIAIGEGTHGTSEFFATQRHITEALITNHTARLILLELPAIPAAAMNTALRGEATEIESLIRGFPFETWGNTEILELMHFARRWNSTHPADTVELRGIDPQLPENVELLPYLLPSTDPRRESLIDWCRAARTLHNRFASSEVEHAPPQITPDRGPPSTESPLRKAVVATVEGGHDLLARLDDLPMAAYLLRVSCQQLSYRARCLGHSRQVQSDARDRLMAANCIREVRRLEPGTRAVVLAHNSHVAFGRNDLFSNGMGHYLRRLYGAEGYKVIATTGGGGSVTSRASMHAPNRDTFVSDSPLPGSLEERFDKVDMPSAWFDFRTMQRFPLLRAVLSKPHAFRSMGALVLKNEFSVLVPTEQFDGVIYFRHTHGSTL